jgi:N-methylhydantoinase A
VQIVGVTSRPNFEAVRPFTDGAPKPATERPIYEHGKQVTASIRQRSSLNPGDTFDGPAVVEQYDTTIYIPDGFKVTIDRWHNLIGERRK